ncbi:MAG: hypothetical protein A2486_16190 [Burkholderiales bacterium RIFOXYC12_FULL_65_23]|uniref:hypothetical protein n=1 Tax=Malikia spinosa TaxID=86180 RepID=UPI0008BA6CA1|nr:MAG: hypothetical protein A2486_16190 [Burkholderiales bacterium RIFOXYC12_FULL_65_23]
MSTRIYLVTDRDTQTQRLIRAANQAQAVRHAAQSRFDIQVASQDTLVELLDAGQKVESAAQATETEPDAAT